MEVVSIGVGKHDLEGNHRKLSERYALDNPKGVRLLLQEYHALVERQYQGDYAAVDILVDMANAIAMAGLTNRQREVLHMVYVEDLTQETAGLRLGIRKDTVNRHLKIAETKIARVYEKWARSGEGYSLSKETEELIS